MNEAKDNVKVDFMKYAITYLENRVSLVDNKTNLLIAATGILLGAYTLIIKTFFVFDEMSRLYSVVVHVCLAIIVLLGTAVILLLLQAIRPSSNFFCGDVPMITRESPEKYVLWPTEKFPDACGNDFYKKMASISEIDICENYKYVHCLSLCFVRNKYHWYRKACSILKILVVVTALSMALLMFLKAHQSQNSTFLQICGS